MQLPIKAKRLYITKFNADMAESVHITSLDEDNRRFVPDEVFETINDAEEIISTITSWYTEKDSPLVYAIYLNDERYIGHVQAVPIPGGWEIGYHIAKPHTGKGYATEATNAFLPQIMRHLGIKRIFGICHAENISSRRVLEKCGFILVFEGVSQYHGKEQMVCQYKRHCEFDPLEKKDKSADTCADS